MDRVRHVSKPSEPFASQGAIGRICKDPHTEEPRITPAARGIPAQAYVDWGDFCTWEDLKDLIPLAEKTDRKKRA